VAGGRQVREDDPSALALLVDRDADTRELYATCLRAAGYDVEEAEDGREALAKAIELHPDIVITETRLPGMDGFTLCARLLKESSTRDIPIVFVTGDAFERDLQRARDAGGEAVLVKPCAPDDLLAEVRRVHARSVALRAQRKSFRQETTKPPNTPPVLVCPLCDEPVRYLRSEVGGVSVRYLEQWDYFECAAGCGTFQYRQRTRKLRKV